MSATISCLCIAATYVAPLYLWADGPRNEPGTILRRMGATLACCCVAWIPLWLSMPYVRTSATASNLCCLRPLAQRGGVLLMLRVPAHFARKQQYCAWPSRRQIATAMMLQKAAQARLLAVHGISLRIDVHAGCHQM